MFLVGDEYRRNRRSLTPGGFTVCITDCDNQTKCYNKIKNPRKYVGFIEKQQIKKIWVAETNEVLFEK
jgi:hypothetical protein